MYMGKIRPTSIGGQAVIEGVMMRGPKYIATAVRKPDCEIIVDKKENNLWIDKLKLKKIPIVRGLISFFESMIIGISSLMFSAKFFDVEEEHQTNKNNDEINTNKKETKDNEKKDETLSPWMITVSIITSLAFSIGLFILLPNFISSLVVPQENVKLYNLLECILRMTIFLLYLFLVSQMKDIRRVFEYHGAEHKTIFCYEHGEELTILNVKKYSRFHPRCGTSFLLFVMIVSFIVFSIIGRNPNLFINLLYRLLVLPLVAGIAYEIIKFAGKRSENKIVSLLIQPGLWLQRLTTKEPDESQIEVAIESLKAVLPQNGEDDRW